MGAESTDGVSETFSPQGELFGRERVGRLLEECRDCPSEELVARLDEALADHRDRAALADDLTIVAVAFDGRPLEQGQRRLQTARESAMSSTKVPLS